MLRLISSKATWKDFLKPSKPCHDAKNPEKSLKSWQMGTHLRKLIKSYTINTNMTGFRWFSKNLASSACDERSLSTGWVNSYATGVKGLNYDQMN